jgi:hypothetical protein
MSSRIRLGVDESIRAVGSVVAWSQHRAWKLADVCRAHGGQFRRKLYRPRPSDALHQPLLEPE